jgi:hypothetical protein
MSTVKPNLTHECVLELLKLSFNVNECKPLTAGSRWLSPHTAAAVAACSPSRNDGCVLSPSQTAMLTLLMAGFGWMMCMISRNEDNRAREYFVKEFRRRREIRLWSLISNMLPPAVVQLLHNKDTSKGKAADATENDDWDPDLPYSSFFQSDIVGTDTLAWNLPHTCLFQSDIVGFTELTQRIAPHQLVSMLHALFAAIDGRGLHSSTSQLNLSRF